VRTVAVNGLEVPGDEPDRPLSHTEVETMLIEQGIIAPVVASTHQPAPADRDVAAAAREHMTHILGGHRNGDEHHDGKAMATRTKATAPITIATFEC
jgi:hypothetical protein